MSSSCITIHRPSISHNAVSHRAGERRQDARVRRDGWRTADEVRAMLRELAYVLHVTRKISAEIRKSPAPCPEGRLALCCD
jgi:hypothetical protein